MPASRYNIVCSIDGCKATFDSQDSLRRHLDGHPNRAACPFCRDYYMKTGLNNHITSMHPEVRGVCGRASIGSQNNVHHCGFAGCRRTLGFKSAALLKDHQDSEHGRSIR